LAPARDGRWRSKRIADQLPQLLTRHQTRPIDQLACSNANGSKLTTSRRNQEPNCFGQHQRHFVGHELPRPGPTRPACGDCLPISGGPCICIPETGNGQLSLSDRRPSPGDPDVIGQLPDRADAVVRHEQADSYHRHFSKR
jgi:hypothetical protein